MTVNAEDSRDVTRHERGAQLDRLDTEIESIEAMSRYLGVANGAIAFSLVSFVGSLLGGGVALDGFVRGLAVLSIASSLLAAFAGLVSIQGLTKTRRNLATVRYLFSNNRWDSAVKVFDETDIMTRRLRLSLPLYCLSSLTAASAALALSTFALVMLP